MQGNDTSAQHNRNKVIRSLTLTRISTSGCGVSNERIVVTIGPPRPHTTIVSPSRNMPFTRITSIVVPRPSICFTSSTEHSNFGSSNKRFDIIVCVSCTNMYSKSGTPSPLQPQQGSESKNKHKQPPVAER